MLAVEAYFQPIRATTPTESCSVLPHRSRKRQAQEQMEAAAHGSETPRVPTSARQPLIDEGPTPVNTAFKDIMAVRPHQAYQSQPANKFGVGVTTLTGVRRLPVIEGCGHEVDDPWLSATLMST